MCERRKDRTKDCVDALKCNVLCGGCALLNMNPLGAAAHSVGRQLDSRLDLESPRLNTFEAAMLRILVRTRALDPAEILTGSIKVKLEPATDEEAAAA